MRVLGIDIGSSSVKVAVLTGAAPRRFGHAAYKTTYDVRGELPRAEVPLRNIDRAIRAALAELGDAVRTVDRIAISAMSPSWLALDARGRPLTSVVTHQDRRSLEQAREIERRVGKARHLKLAGNRPVPGGISSTTLAWHLAHEKSAMRKAAIVGHLGTWLAHALTGTRVIDRSQAGFTGLLDIRKLEWSDELIAAVGVDRALLPRVVESDEIIGRVTRAAARRYGLLDGVEVVAGCVDGSGAMFAVGARPGQLVNVSGSTDVLALCVDAPSPAEGLLTRPLGVGRRWLSVGTIAAAGTALSWARKTLFADLDEKAFFRHVAQVARRPAPSTTFDNALAGSRTEVEPRSATIGGLTLATRRDDILAALVADLARESGARLQRIADANADTTIHSDVIATGGGGELASTVFRRDWPKRFRFRVERESTLRGLFALATGEAR